MIITGAKGHTCLIPCNAPAPYRRRSVSGKARSIERVEVRCEPEPTKDESTAPARISEKAPIEN